ncbi:hypothetical protein [Stenotrophomonas acidaminiphila]
MKLQICLLVALALVPSMAGAQENPEIINLKGHDYTVSRALPGEILGKYLYEGKGEPIVEIRADGTGVFQPHDMPAIPIRIWIDVDEKGTPRREVGSELRYRYTLLVQYGVSSNGNYPSGSYGLLDVTLLKDEGIAMVLGERIRRL